MASRASLLLSLCLAIVSLASAWVTGPSLFAPALRPAASSGVTTICMGRKGAQTGQGGGATRTVTREKKKKGGGGTAVTKVKKVKGVDVTRSMILEKLDGASKDNFASEILSEKIETFMKEEAGSSMYPRLMKKIKAKANFLGVSVPDRWAYEAMANKYQRAKLAEKIEAANAPADEEEGAAEGEAESAEEAAA